jgi:cyanophycinase
VSAAGADGGPGPLVLAGSGEYTPAMDIVDQHLLGRLDGRPVLLIATACAPEGADVMARWEQMGFGHFARLGVKALPLRIADRSDADLPENAALIWEAGLVWFSGGSAAYLARAFEATRAWEALKGAHARGAAIAGASGGLGVLNPHLPDPSAGAGQPRTGLGLAAPVRAISHFDRLEARRPEMVERVLSLLPAGQRLVGVDEDTAAVWEDGAWRVMGHKRVLLIERGGGRRAFSHGDLLEGLPPPRSVRPAD